MPNSPFTTQDLLRLINAHESEIKKVNEAIMSRQFHAVGAVYFDHQCLKDTRLGLLISLSNPDRMEYLKAHLSAYNLRPNRNFLFAFPEFPYREVELKKWYTDPNRSEHIFNVAPDTDLTKNLPIILNLLRENNSRVGYKQQVSIYINMWPLKLTPLMDRYQEFLQYLADPSSLSIKVHLICTDPVTITSDFWARMGMCFIDDIARLTSVETPLVKPLFEELGMSNTSIYAALQCDDDVLEKWKEEGVDFIDPEQIAQRFEISAALFSMCCKFTFMAFRIPIPSEVKKNTPNITTS